MAKIQTINNGEDGLPVRDKLNDNFRELAGEVMSRVGQKALTISSTVTLPNDGLTFMFAIKANASSTIKIDEQGGDNVAPEMTLAENETLNVTWFKGYIASQVFDITLTGNVDIWLVYQDQFFTK